MKRFALPALLVGLWLYAWANNTGVLVWSSDEYGVRSCYYLIGVTVLEERLSRYGFARRCRLLTKVY